MENEQFKDKSVEAAIKILFALNLFDGFGGKESLKDYLTFNTKKGYIVDRWKRLSSSFTEIVDKLVTKNQATTKIKVREYLTS